VTGRRKDFCMYLSLGLLFSLSRTIVRLYKAYKMVNTQLSSTCLIKYILAKVTLEATLEQKSFTYTYITTVQSLKGVLSPTGFGKSNDCAVLLHTL
jgi:hypothetical protein